MRGNVTLLNHVGWFRDHGICQSYFLGPSNKVGVFIYYLYIRAELGNLGRVILLTLCAGSIAHPNNIPHNIH